MRSFLSVVAAAFVVVCASGCTTAVDGKATPAPPTRHACADTFAGTWSVVGTTKDTCGGATMPPLSVTLTIDETLTKMEGTDNADGETVSLEISPTTELVQPCDYLSASLVRSGEKATTKFVFEFKKPDGLESTIDSLTGTTTVLGYTAADFAAQGTSAPPICTVSYPTYFSRSR